MGSEKSNEAELLAVPTAKGIVDLKGPFVTLLD